MANTESKMRAALLAAYKPLRDVMNHPGFTQENWECASDMVDTITDLEMMFADLLEDLADKKAEFSEVAEAGQDADAATNDRIQNALWRESRGC